ncbi:MAG: glycosyl transferase, partial [Desulfurococcaceae archaeon]
STAYELYAIEVERGGRGYVTDETWYASSARVVLCKLFGAEPTQDEGYGATVVFAWRPSPTLVQGIAKGLGLKARTDFENLPAVYISGDKNAVYAFIEAINESHRVVDVVPGWIMPDNSGINSYINWEHPPLGKYLVSLVMLLFGDTPFYWRTPVVTLGVFTAILVYLSILKLTGSVVASALGAALAAIDPLSRAVFSIVLLDGYVAFFAVLSLYMALSKRYRLALFTAAIGGLFKASGLFTALPLALLVSWDEASSGGKRSLWRFAFSLLYYLFIVAVLYLSLLTLASIPLISYMGLSSWFNTALVGALKWHLSTKCTGPSCPISSAPWDWLMGQNSFTLYIYPSGEAVYARGLVPLWALSLALVVLFVPLTLRDMRKNVSPLMLYAGIWLGYILIWALGSRTQYSFYAIHLEPLVYINAASFMYAIIADSDVLLKALRAWREALGLFAKALKRLPWFLKAITIAL